MSYLISRCELFNRLANVKTLAAAYAVIQDMPTVECGDTISRQAAKNKKVYSEERHEYVIPVAEIDWLPSVQPAQRWIPCSERLPKEQKSYWVCTDTGYQCECRFTDNVYGLGVGALGWKVFDIPQFSRVIAWMELPESYKEEE